MQTTGSEQLADRNHVLVADAPHRLAFVHRIEKVNMGTHQSGRVRARELLVNHARRLDARRRPTGASDHEDLAVGERGQYLHALPERVRFGGQHQRRIGGQRTGVHGGDKDRVRCRGRRGHLAERAGAQCRPESGIDQVVAHLLATKRGELCRLVTREFTLLAAIDIDHDREQEPLVATIDRRDGARRGSRELHPLGTLVDEQRLAPRHPVADPHQHAGLQARVVRAQHCHGTDFRAGMDHLLRRSTDGQIQSTAYRDHSYPARLEQKSTTSYRLRHSFIAVDIALRWREGATRLYGPDRSPDGEHPSNGAQV